MRIHPRRRRLDLVQIGMLATLAVPTAAQGTAPGASHRQDDPVETPAAPGKAAVADPATSGEGGAELEVTHLANDGFLLRAGDAALLIDAFVVEPYAGYAGLPPEAAESLAAARPPFDGIDIALASHYHADHFQPKPACEFLAASPDTLLASSPQVLEALAILCRRETARSVLPEVGQIEVLEHAGIGVEFLRLSHGSGRYARIQNLGHRISLGGFRVLHIGDAEMEVATFTPYDLAAVELDLVFVPYWYFGDARGRYIVEKSFAGAALVASHVPTAELETVAAGLAEEFPQVVLFRQALEKRSFPMRRSKASR